MEITTSILMDSYDPNSHTMAGAAQMQEIHGTGVLPNDRIQLQQEHARG
jgi:hypothetical protein